MSTSLPWQQLDDGSYSDMSYLTCEAAQARYVLAAWYLRGCPHVLEIGGFKTPVTGFLDYSPQSVQVLDPKMPEWHGGELNGKPCRIDHLPVRFQDHDPGLEPGSYGLVILGCSMKYFSDDEDERRREWSKLIGLINGARITVLEYPVDWGLSNENVAQILEGSDTTVRMRLDLDLAASEGMDTPYTLRRFMVLVPRTTRSRESGQPS